MGEYYVVAVEGKVLEIIEGEGALEDARESAKKHAQEREDRVLVLRPIGYAEPAIKWKSVP